MEDNCLGLHFPVFNVHFVPAQNYGDVFTDSHQISMPIRDIFVGYSGRNIKHDDPTLSLDVVAISESTKLLLSGCIPHVETDGTSVGVENQWVYFHTQSG